MVREMNELDSAPLVDGGSFRSPFFSPDGRSIGFFTNNADGEIQRASIAGGSPMRVSGYSGIPRGGSWGSDNSIVFATTDEASGLLRVSSSGGEPTVLTTPDMAHGELDHLFPSVLPNGQAVLFTIQRTTGGSLQNADVGVLDLTTGQRKVLIRGSQAEYMKSGHLVYAVEGTLNAVRFDLARLEVVDEPVRVIDQMMIGQLLGVNFAVSQDATLAYLPASGSQPELRSLVWVTRDGREEPLSAAGRRPYAAARLSLTARGWRSMFETSARTSGSGI